MRIVQIGEHCKFNHIKLIGTTPVGKPCTGCFFRSKFPDCEIYLNKMKVTCYDYTNPLDRKDHILIKL